MGRSASCGFGQLLPWAVRRSGRSLPPIDYLREELPTPCHPPPTLVNSKICTVRRKTGTNQTDAIERNRPPAPMSAHSCGRSNAPDTNRSLKPEKERRIKNEQVRKVFSSRDRFRAPCEFCPHSRGRDQGSCQRSRL